MRPGLCIAGGLARDVPMQEEGEGGRPLFYEMNTGAFWGWTWWLLKKPWGKGGGLLIVFIGTFELSPLSEPRKRPKGHCCVFIPLHHIEKQYLTTVKITSIKCSLYARYCSDTSYEWSHWIFTKLTWSISSRWGNRGTERLTNLPRAAQRSSDLGFQPWHSVSRAQTCIHYILLPSHGPQRDLGPNPGSAAYQLWDSGLVTTSLISIF